MCLRRCYGIGLAVLITSFVGCGYGEVSGETYEYAKALYSIGNRHDSERLDEVAEMIRSARTAGRITKQESNWLNDIIQLARNDEWETAARRARDMMEDQVK